MMPEDRDMFVRIKKINQTIALMVPVLHEHIHDPVAYARLLRETGDHLTEISVELTQRADVVDLGGASRQVIDQ